MTTLGLDNNLITDEQLKHLAGLTQLMRLDLQNTNITDLELLKEFTQLTSLDLQKNQITDVSALASLTQLTRLGLTG